jgi:hypothetical protein
MNHTVLHLPMPVLPDTTMKQLKTDNQNINPHPREQKEPKELRDNYWGGRASGSTGVDLSQNETVAPLHE